MINEVQKAGIFHKKKINGKECGVELEVIDDIVWCPWCKIKVEPGK